MRIEEKTLFLRYVNLFEEKNFAIFSSKRKESRRK